MKVLAKLQTKEESEVRVMCALKIVGTPVFRETFVCKLSVERALKAPCECGCACWLPDSEDR